MKPDFWWIDAGWYECGDSWGNYGSWHPDPKRFPRGLRPVADEAHALGMKLIAWFAPEFAAPRQLAGHASSRLVREQQH